VIKRSQLGLAQCPWSELIRPHVSGILASHDLLGRVAGTSTTTVVEFPDKMGQVRIQHGLVEESDTPEECYLIDSDFSTEQKTEINHATDVLDTFNRQSGRLFRWCITERLHDAMEPQSLAA